MFCFHNVFRHSKCFIIKPSVCPLNQKECIHIYTSDAQERYRLCETEYNG